MNELAPRQKSQLPKIEELYADSELTIKQSELNVLLNQSPKSEWIKSHPFITKEIINNEGKKEKVPMQYLPIERLQWLMNRIFGGYQREIKEVKLIANSVQVTIRIHYRDILTGEMMFQDGVGAVPLQTDKDAGATNFDKIKSNSVQIGAPAAASFAEKDAIGMLGRLFGRDLNRVDETAYTSAEERFDNVKSESLKKQLSDLISNCQDNELTDKIVDEITEIEKERKPIPEDYERWIAMFKK